MTSISASTSHSLKVKKPAAAGLSLTKKNGVKGGKTTNKAGRRGSIAPPLQPSTLNSAESVQELKALSVEQQTNHIIDMFRACIGEPPLILDKSKPHTASTSQSRSGAAADVAVAAREIGIGFVLRKCGVQDDMQRTLFPQGMASLFQQSKPDDESDDIVSGLKPSMSSLSLASMDDTTVTTMNSTGTDSKRGKSTPPDAREGCLLLIRALCETVGKPVEPFVVGGFLAAALDECGSSSSSVRQAAEDAAQALVSLAHPWAFPRLICPLLIQSLHSTEWRVKFNALERLAQCAKTAPKQVCQLLPKLIPVVTSQVWDTKAQVTKASRECLMAMCQTNENPDVLPAIPAVVNAICKPADTNKAVQELMGTTFVASVDAPTLSILCPVLARALKEKLAINKRAACIVVSNMSRLVDSPQAVAPFGPLLVPELKKVASNVQFEEIRDAALSALSNLTKALGSSYSADEQSEADKMAEESARVAAEQQRIEEERQAELKREEELRKKEEEERKKYKEAMDAQRELDKIAAEEAAAKKKEQEIKREQQKLSTKAASGKCQACGLKKCKKTCTFYTG
jgi:hypothetical protein